jgi:hypothetical protein
MAISGRSSGDRQECERRTCACVVRACSCGCVHLQDRVHPGDQALLLGSDQTARAAQCTRDVSAHGAAARFSLGHTSHPPGAYQRGRVSRGQSAHIGPPAVVRAAECRNDVRRGRCGCGQGKSQCGCGPASHGSIRSATSACLNSSASSNAALQLRRVSSRHWLKAWTYRRKARETEARPLCA